MGPKLRVKKPAKRSGNIRSYKITIRLPRQVLRDINNEMIEWEKRQGKDVLANPPAGSFAAEAPVDLSPNTEHISPNTSANGALKPQIDSSEDDEDVTDFSDDLSMLEVEINRALMSSMATSVSTGLTQEIHTQTDLKHTNNADLHKAIKEEKNVKPEQKTKQEHTLETQINPETATEHDGSEYRSIPRNLTDVIRKELVNDDEDIGMIEKMVFTLKDPLSATKISLPVKPSLCLHFECFDFETFCVFNKIPEGIKYVIRKGLVKKNYDMKRYEKERGELREKLRQQPKNSRSINMQLQKLQRELAIPAYTAKFNPYNFPSPKIPNYRCPICDRHFELHQLYISDAYNFFVKTTPKDISRVELVDMVKYRILDDRPTSSAPHKGEEEEIIVLSDDDEEESGGGGEASLQPTDASAVWGPGDNETRASTPYRNDESDDIFNDGLDGALLSMGTQGAGSWEDPVVL